MEPFVLPYANLVLLPRRMRVGFVQLFYGFEQPSSVLVATFFFRWSFDFPDSIWLPFPFARRLPQATCPGSLFQCAYKKTSQSYAHMVSKKSNAWWQTFNHKSFSALVADNKLRSYLVSRNCVASATKLWTGDYFERFTLYKHLWDDKIMMNIVVLNDVGLFWQVQHVDVPPTTLWELSQNTRTAFIFRPLLDFNEWKVIPYKYPSPVELLKLNGWKDFVCGMPSAFGVQTADDKERQPR